MGEVLRTAASLRFFGDDLDPDQVTYALGKSSGTFRTANYGTWLLEVERRSPGDLNGQIAELLKGTTDDLEIWRSLSQRFQSDIFCGLFLNKQMSGIDVSPQTMLTLGERGLLLDLDIEAAESRERCTLVSLLENVADVCIAAQEISGDEKSAD